MRNYKKLQDTDCDWYWVPLEMVDDFKRKNKELEGKEYLDDPYAFDLFHDNFGKFRTGGCPDNKPDYYKEKESERNGEATIINITIGYLQSKQYSEDEILAYVDYVNNKLKEYDK